jgi:hypothetical protein
MEYKTNPVKAIREKCLDCCCGSTSEVKDCTVERCPLYPYRLGKNPFRQKREMSEEQRKAVGDRLRESRKNNSGSEEDDEE